MASIDSDNHSQDQGVPKDLNERTKRLLFAVHTKDVKLLLQSLNPLEDAHNYIHEIDIRPDGDESEGGSTVLSHAIRIGQDNIIHALLDCCEPLTLEKAIHDDYKLEESEAWWKYGEPEFPEWWSQYQPNDPSAIALSALFETEGNESGFNLKGAKNCDVGRSLWFWAVRNGYLSIVNDFLDSGFPLDLCSSRTGYHHSSTQDKWKRSNRQRPPKKEYPELAPLGTNAVWNAAHTGNIELMQLLIGKGAAIKAQLKEKHKPITLGGETGSRGFEYSIDIFLAACHGFVERYYQYMLPSRGAEDELQDSSFMSTYSSVIALLLEQGANPNPHPNWATPLEVSQQKSPFYGIGPDLVPAIIDFARLGLWAEVEVLLEKGANIRAIDDQGKSIAHFAARESDPENLGRLLRQDFDVNTSDRYGYNLIHEAVYAGSYEAVRILISCNVDLRATTRGGATALLLAIESMNLQMVRVLLDAGADADQHTPFSPEYDKEVQEERERYIKPIRSYFYASTPLVAALGRSNPDNLMETEDQNEDVRFRIVSLLIDRGADPLKEGLASRYHLKYRAGIHYRSQDGLTVAYPISVAVQFRRLVCLRLLINTAGRRITRLMLDDAMCAACESDYVFTKSAAHTDSGHLREEEMDLLLNLGADPNVITARGASPLHIACLAGRLCAPLIKKLLNLGASVEFQDATGKTVLHYAAVFCPDALPILLGNDPSLYIEDDEGWNAFQYACAGPKGFLSSSLEHLRPENHHTHYFLDLVCGLDIEESLPMLVSILDTERSFENNLAQRDFYTGMNAVHTSARNEFTGLLRVICQSPRKMSIYAVQTSDRKTPLILAAAKKLTGNVRLLLQGISIAIGAGDEVVKHGKSRQYYIDRDNSGPTENDYSHVASENGYIEEPLSSETPSTDSDGGISVILNNEDEGNQLSSSAPEKRKFRPLSTRERSIILNTRTQYGWTALHYAASHGNSEMVELLVAERNIDLAPPQTRAAPSPLDLARASGNPLCVAALKDALAARERRERDAMKETESRIGNWKSRLVLAIRGLVVFACMVYLYRKHVEKGFGY
ncbi:hypothetical protein MMC13_000882 [Lambiella insularis]|nr:hypothetical protein [Lambiella insularis]